MHSQGSLWAYLLFCFTLLCAPFFASASGQFSVAQNKTSTIYWTQTGSANCKGSTDYPNISDGVYTGWTQTHFGSGNASATFQAQGDNYFFECDALLNGIKVVGDMAKLAVVAPPQNLAATCSSSGVISISATGYDLPGALYPVRVNDVTTSTNFDAANSAGCLSPQGNNFNGDYCIDNVTKSPLTVQGVVGHTYNIWIHTLYNNTWSDPATLYSWTCPAPAAVSGTDGQCGTADGKTYANGSTSYSPDTQCAAGTPSTTAFPTAGNTQTWSCSGTNGGAASKTCSAKQAGASCTLPWGGTIPDGTPVTAYQVSSGSTCPSETRLCTNGVLSGSFQFGSCTTSGGSSCTSRNYCGTDGNAYSQDASCNITKTACPSGCSNGTCNAGSAASISVSVNSDYSTTLPSQTVVAAYTLTGGTSSNTNCRLLDYQGQPLNSYTACTGNMTITAPAAAGKYGYYIEALQSSSGAHAVSGEFYVTVNPVPASCGAANNVASFTAPSGNSYLCSSGSASTVQSNFSSWMWTCSGGSSNVSCSAPQEHVGACGTSDGGSFETAPAANLCSYSLTRPTVTQSGGMWVWTCTGDEGTDASCSAVITPKISLSASVLRTQAETPFTLSWSVSQVKAKSCSITGTDNSSQTIKNKTVDAGSVTTSIESRTAFTLTCLDLEGSPISTSVTVNLIPKVQEI